MGKVASIIVGILFFSSLVHAQNPRGLSQDFFELHIKSKQNSQNIKILKDALFFLNEDLLEPKVRPWSESFDLTNYQRALTNSWYGLCRNPKFYNYPIQEYQSEGLTQLISLYQPEFLYSWGSQQKLDELKQVAGQGRQVVLIACPFHR